jgi:hypothetical protein
MVWDVDETKKIEFFKKRCPNEMPDTIDYLIENEDYDNNMVEAAKPWYAIIDCDYQNIIIGANTKEGLVKKLISEGGVEDDAIVNIYFDGQRVDWEFTLVIKEPWVVPEEPKAPAAPVPTMAEVVSETEFVETPVKPKNDGPFSELF